MYKLLARTVLARKAKWCILLTTFRLKKSAWSPSIGEVLSLQTDAENEHDTYAVGTITDSTVVGHDQ